jgi:two-component system response regulator YesN
MVTLLPYYFYIGFTIRERGAKRLMRSNSLRMRYILSLLLVMVPILLFSIILFTSNHNRSVQYINSASLQNFTYAAENISAVFSRLNYSAETAFAVESRLELDDLGNIHVPSPGSLCADLDTLEQRITPDVTALFYIKGDKYLYSAEGMLLYGDYERQYLQAYNLSLSSVFSSLQRVSAPTVVPLISSGDGKQLSGLVYALPFPTNTASVVPAIKGVLLFVLADDVISAEFENYMGNLTGSLYLFDRNYTLLYSGGADETGLTPALAIKIRGTGVLTTTQGGQDLVLLRTADSDLGLTWMMAIPETAFYESMIASEKVMLNLIAALVLLLLGLIVWIAFFNYKPIEELVQHVTGYSGKRHYRNELELIRDYYDQSVDEAEMLSSYLSEMTPLVAQQFVNRLIFGHIISAAEFEKLASRAAMDFSRPWSVAMYLVFSRQTPEIQMEQAMLSASYYKPNGAFAALGELPSENALCVILNFDAPEEALNEAAEDYARQLCAHMAANNVQPDRIGIGCAYASPLKMNESFAEACAAAQLAPSGRQVWHYREDVDAACEAAEDKFRGLSPLSLSLLSEGLHRGDKSIALRALNDMFLHISRITHSLAFFRFCCSELLTAIIRQGDALQVPVSKARIQQLIAISSQNEFAQGTAALVGDMCDAIRRRISDNEQQQKQSLLNFILDNYKRSDLSIQVVADETGIRKAQITTCIKEETGQGFVQYVSFLRMNEFKRLLLQSKDTIRELVRKIGYNDVPNFLRKFKSIEGMTPGQYRALHGK